MGQTSTFGADQPITGTEAALLIQNALDLTVSTVAMESEDMAMAVLAENGLALQPQAMNRSQVAVVLYQVKCMAPSAPGMQVFA